MKKNDERRKRGAVFRVHVHPTTGEKLGSFEARAFDTDLSKQNETGLQKYAYAGPEGEEATIYLDPRGVAAIEVRPAKEGPGQRSPGQKLESPASGGRNLLAIGDEPDGNPPPRGPGGNPDVETPTADGGRKQTGGRDRG